MDKFWERHPDIDENGMNRAADKAFMEYFDNLEKDKKNSLKKSINGLLSNRKKGASK